MKPEKHLLLDSRIIESTENARLTVGRMRKDPRNPLFGEDKPWEPRFDNLYPNIIYDREEQLFKCWYSPFIIDESTSNTPGKDRKNGGKFRYLGGHTGRHREMGVCYAVSRDGIRWEKPNLGIVDFQGSKANNIVVLGPHGTGVIKDLHDPDPKRRYKMFFSGRVMSVAFSSDGIHWDEAIECPEVDVAGDTHNHAFWAPTLDKWVGITRTWAPPRGRQVARTDSQDFIKWHSAEVILEGLEDHLQTYAMPVSYYAGVYIGLPAIFNSETDRTHTELAWSPDTVSWHRIDPGTPLIPNGGRKGAYDWGCVYGANIPVIMEDGIRLYYGGSNDRHGGWRDGFFCLATLRPDGFAGYEQNTDNISALINTTTVPYSGQVLSLNADVQKDGYVKTRLLDTNGKELAIGQLLRQTASDRKVNWLNGFDMHTLENKTIRLAFELKKAKLYSFSFHD